MILKNTAVDYARTPDTYCSNARQSNLMIGWSDGDSAMTIDVLRCMSTFWSDFLKVLLFSTCKMDRTCKWICVILKVSTFIQVMCRCRSAFSRLSVKGVRYESCLVLFISQFDHQLGLSPLFSSSITPCIIKDQLFANGNCFILLFDDPVTFR